MDLRSGASDRREIWRDMLVTRCAGNLIAEEEGISDLAEQLLRVRKKRRQVESPSAWTKYAGMS